MKRHLGRHLLGLGLALALAACGGASPTADMGFVTLNQHAPKSWFDKWAAGAQKMGCQITHQEMTPGQELMNLNCPNPKMTVTLANLSDGQFSGQCKPATDAQCRKMIEDIDLAGEAK